MLSAATFKVELKSPARKDGTFAVRIRITRFRKHAYWNLGRYVEKGELNKAPKERLKNWVLKNADAPQINDAIHKTLKGLGKVADDNPAATATSIKELYEKELNPEPEAPKQEQGYFAYFQEYINRIAELNVGSGKALAAARNSFRTFTGTGLKDEDLLSPAMLHKFRLSLNKLQPSTIQGRFNILKTIYRNGVLEGRVKQLGNPFKGIRIVVPEKVQPRPTAEHIIKLINYTPKKANLRKARLAALLQFFLHGARVSEAITLEWDKHVFPDKIVYLPAKRATKYKTVPRGPMLNWLLEQMPRKSKYVLPFLKDKDADLTEKQFLRRIVRQILKINYALKLIDEQLEIGLNLSSHMMRRAFLDNVMNETNDLLAAQNLAGHSNAKTTQGYLQGPDAEATRKLSESLYSKFAPPGKEGEQ